MTGLQNSALRERHARAYLLPTLFQFAQAHRRRFQRADNEEHALSDLKPRKRKEMWAEWRTANHSLGRLEAATQDVQLRNALFELRIRGEQLFGRAKVSHKDAFESLLGRVRVAAAPAEETAVDAAVARLLMYFPSQEVDRATMKSVLQAAVHTTKRETVRLQAEAGWELVAKQAPVLQALGLQHTRANYPRVGHGFHTLSAALADRSGPHLGWLSKRLLARDAFAKFDFVAARSSIGSFGSELSLSSASKWLSGEQEMERGRRGQEKTNGMNVSAPTFLHQRNASSVSHRS